MDEFAEARAALVTLEKRKQGLIAELNDVHAAIRSQRNKLEELIRRLPVSPINRLPDEILLRIFELILIFGTARTEDKNCCVRWKGQLVEVSRQWRNVILHSPCLWTTIRVSPSWNTARIEAHIMRSSKSPLDIEISPWRNSYVLKDRPLLRRLELVVPCAERWRSLTISSVVSSSTFRVLQRLDHLSLPSLTSVWIERFPCCEPGKFDLPFLQPQRTPLIEKIFISGDIGMLKGREIPSSVKTLAVESTSLRWKITSALLLEFVPCQRLTSLCLGNFTNSEELPPNSIQLPLLEKFVSRGGVSAALICAIVAPRLKHFECHELSAYPSLHDRFVAVGGKFSNVDHLELHAGSQRSQRYKPPSQSLRLAFPGVRHLVLSRVDAIAILPSAEDPGTVFHWQHLESLTSIGYPEEEVEEKEKKAFIDNLANCLRRRQEAGQSKLRLTFPMPFSVERFLFVYEQLNDLCILECAYNTHDITLSGVTSSKPWLVRTSSMYTC
ncbi:hypothetical protein F5J12DRAFT_820113 [Pisolithus orientalis]|uniref:uncharacterized protein n=1 Tax=Pisolithus orientalis TaxID=936130 RepID=UPI002224DBD8|nr:uncharacterized protein F5J12DRAFT_820113 [Pisolithus orientalis]KAI6012733.1 hypothetical protein F5J12DRAFT_820113 [Pisolithus orientalis]